MCVIRSFCHGTDMYGHLQNGKRTVLYLCIKKKGFSLQDGVMLFFLFRTNIRSYDPYPCKPYYKLTLKKKCNKNLYA